MKFGVREICDVVLKAKAAQKVGDKLFYKNEPVIYFDTLKTSTMEGAATTVYAQGGRGNARLVAWEGERTITFTMEDALISPAGFMIWLKDICCILIGIWTFALVWLAENLNHSQTTG